MYNYNFQYIRYITYVNLSKIKVSDYLDRREDAINCRPKGFAFSRRKPLIYLTTRNSSFFFSLNTTELRALPDPPQSQRNVSKSIFYPSILIHIKHCTYMYV